MNNLTEIIGDYSKFLEGLLEGLKQIKLDVASFEIDHLCYRVTDYSRYEIKKKELSTVGELLAEEMVNGRPIATYRFHTPLKFGHRQIPLIELPAPKNNSSYEEGLEHCEFVTGFDLTRLIEKYPEASFHTANQFSKINPDISLQLASGGVKFHPTSLADVIKEEQKLSQEKQQPGHPLYRTPRCVIFDLDETLSDTAHTFQTNFIKVLSDHFRREVSWEEFQQKNSTNYKGLFANFEITNAAVMSRLVQRSGVVWPDSPQDPSILFPGIKTVLDMLKRENVSINMWTARERESVEKSLKHLGIEHYFENVFCYVEGDGGKPFPPPELVRLVAAHPGASFLIGDSMTDVKGAENLGIPLLLACWGNTKNHDYDHPEKFKTPVECLSRILR